VVAVEADADSVRSVEGNHSGPVVFWAAGWLPDDTSLGCDGRKNRRNIRSDGAEADDDAQRLRRSDG